MSESEVENDQEEQETRPKFDRTKKFVKKHWLPITVGVVCITVTYIVTRRVTLRGLPIEGISIDFFNKPTHKLVEVTIPKAINGIVGSGVFNPVSQVGYFSQGAAARAYGVSDSVLSGHLLSNNPPHVKGEILRSANFRIFAEVQK